MKSLCHIAYLLLLFLSFTVFSAPIKQYKIVIDPGHGGSKQIPYEMYGDKYDIVTGKYLENYKSGAQFHDRTEMEIVMDLAREVQYILDLTRTKRGFRKFKSYIKLFSRSDAPWIILHSTLSRSDNFTDRNFREKDDKNAPYRMYDYPDFKTGILQKGRISKINEEKPELVVSLHINSIGGYFQGMGVVLSPSYRTFELLRKVSSGEESVKTFYNTKWKNWMRFQAGWNTIENAMADAWIYFHGYWSDKSGTKADLKRFEGFRQNMISWAYRDSPGWTNRINTPGPYAIKHEDFEATGPFWEREKSDLELMRREDGPEGFGGDNHYAGMELLRFIQYGFRTEVQQNPHPSFESPDKILPPFISTYSLPTFINGISAYLELGNISSDKDMYFVQVKRRKMAISIAVGIYSLFQGLEVKNPDILYAPKGKKIDFSKYITDSGESYFKVVTKSSEN
ncbi:MAG: N-acetylmuramoyl-L-alanine amidase [Leptospiraceae bacterium]|nr:N-acetylmuramoyl-L-alanine amidase [Leptospiraceae bacterium]MCP5498616.1 N-acetylmuramoyl-L-alanine amidase [Leptospiraceae bacterium]